MADADRRRNAVRHRLYQCDRPMVLDQGIALGAGARSDAVLLPDAGLGARNRVCRLGRRALDELARRVGHCRCDRSVPLSTRSPAPAVIALSSAPARCDRMKPRQTAILTAIKAARPHEPYRHKGGEPWNAGISSISRPE